MPLLLDWSMQMYFTGHLSMSRCSLHVFNNVLEILGLVLDVYHEQASKLCPGFWTLFKLLNSVQASEFCSASELCSSFWTSIRTFWSTHWSTFWTTFWTNFLNSELVHECKCSLISCILVWFKLCLFLG